MILLTDFPPASAGEAVAEQLSGYRPPPILRALASGRIGEWVYIVHDPEAEPRSVDGWRLTSLGLDDESYDRIENIVVHPMLWFIAHGLWDRANTPDFRRHEQRAFEDFASLSEQAANACLAAMDRSGANALLIHGYRLPYTAAIVRAARPQATLRHVVPTAWGEPGDWSVLPHDIAEEIHRGMLASDLILFDSQRDVQRFLRCCDVLFDLDARISVDGREGSVVNGARTVVVRANPLPSDAESLRSFAASTAVRRRVEQFHLRRREYSLLVAGAADLSRNLLRPCTAYDMFLEQHPEFAERVNMVYAVNTVHADVPEYAELLEKVEAMVAVVNQRHGTPDWMPISLTIDPGMDELVAHLQGFDAFVAPSLREGADPLSHAAIALNRHDGVLGVSIETATHEWLGDSSLAFNPYNVQQMADSIYRMLSMTAARRAEQAADARRRALSRSPADWLSNVVHGNRRVTSTTA